MAALPKRVAERLVAGIKRYQPILAAAKARDVGEADTITIIKDMLADVFGYDKYSDVTSEYAIRGTYCDLAIKIETQLETLIEVKAIGLDLKDSHVKQATDYAANQGVDWARIEQAYRLALELRCESLPLDHLTPPGDCPRSKVSVKPGPAQGQLGDDSVSRKCLWYLCPNDLLLNEAVDAVSGDKVMVVTDLPYAPAESPAAISPEKATVHACMQVGADSQATWAERYVDPVLIARVNNNLKARDISNAATSLVEKPGHGSIVDVVDDKTGYHNYRYDPQTGYSGRDRATFVVLISGKTYRVAVDLVVVKDVYDGVNSSGSDSCENIDVEK